MAGTRLQFGAEARAGMLAGIAIAARAVSVAMGPRGRYVMAERDYGPPMLRDGVGIVRVIELPDRHRQMGVELAREVAVQCSDLVGDGTATAVLLFHELASAGMKGLAAGLDSRQFAAGLAAAVEVAAAHIEALAETGADRARMAQIATIAANGDAAIGGVVAEAIDMAGEAGLVTVRVGNGLATTLTSTGGYSFESRPVSEHLTVASRNGVREYEDALVLVVDGGIDGFEALTPLLEAIVDEDRPLLIVAESLGPTTIAGLYENRRGEVLDSMAVRLTVSGDRRGALLSDIAVFTGAEPVSGAAGPALQQAGAEVLGTAARVVFSGSETLLVGGGGAPDAIAARARQLAGAADDGVAGSHDERELRKRGALLAAASVTIEVGGHTELEARERRDRADSAARAVKAALARGHVAGGGVALLAAAEAAKAARNGGLSYDAGVMAVAAALRAPAMGISANGGHDGPAVAARLAGRYPAGLDLASGKDADLLAAGVIDAASVLITALRVAASAAGTLIGTEVAIFRSAEQIS